MTTYRLMDGASGRPGVGSSGTQPPGSSTAATGGWLLGTIFSVTSQVAWLNGYYFWVPPGGDTVARKFALWNRYSSSAQNLVSGSTVTSGTLTAGSMNFVALSPPVQLAPGALYVAATGWTAVNGIPLSSAQFGGSDPYASGITNGILTGWSDVTGSNTFPAAASNYNLGQGLFSNSLGNDPTAAMPNAGGTSDNFWVDVEISDTAPGGYAGSYRLYPNIADFGNFSDDTANNFTLGMEFVLSGACTVDNIWFYSPPGVTQLPTEIGVYQVSDTTLVLSDSSPSWSGAAGSGWVSALSGSLSASVKYKVVVLNGAGSPAVWNGAITDYWSTGFGGSGLTSGPLSAYSNAAADSPGQETYNAGATIAYPATNIGPYSYGVDIEVTPAGGTPHTANQADLGTAFALATSLYGDSLLQLAVILDTARRTASRPRRFAPATARLAGGKPVISVTMRQLYLPERMGSVLAGSDAGIPASAARFRQAWTTVPRSPITSRCNTGLRWTLSRSWTGSRI